MIETFTVYPGYYAGFAFSWTVSCKTTARRPWVFWVEESETGFNDFTPISPRLTDTFAFEEGVGVRRKYNKDANLFFRVAMESAGKITYSYVRTALGDMPFQEFLYAKEIMRKEILQMRNMAGVPVTLFRKIQSGQLCTNCLDPITREVVDPECPICMGTKYITGYHGPYESFATFSVTNSHKQHAADGAGVDNDLAHDIRVIARPWLIRDDIIIDKASDRRYIVHEIASQMELRRIPIVQVVKTTEVQYDSVIYQLCPKVTEVPTTCNTR